MKMLGIAVAVVALMAQAGSRVLDMRAAHGFIPAAAAATPDLRNSVAPSPQTGLASWYGVKYHGRRTASGERYNMYARTAAHHNLPFGTWVRVTNPRNGRSVIVRINDRLPSRSHACIIDLSYLAARELGIERCGLQEVSMRVVRNAGKPLPQN